MNFSELTARDLLQVLPHEITRLNPAVIDRAFRTSNSRRAIELVVNRMGEASAVVCSTCVCVCAQWMSRKSRFVHTVEIRTTRPASQCKGTEFAWRTSDHIWQAHVQSEPATVLDAECEHSGQY